MSKGDLRKEIELFKTFHKYLLAIAAFFVVFIQLYCGELPTFIFLKIAILFFLLTLLFTIIEMYICGLLFRLHGKLKERLIWVSYVLEVLAIFSIVLAILFMVFFYFT